MGRGKEEVTLQWGNLVNNTLPRWSSFTSKVISPADSIYPWYDVTKKSFYLWDFPQTNHDKDIRQVSVVKPSTEFLNSTHQNCPRYPNKNLETS